MPPAATVSMARSSAGKASTPMVAVWLPATVGSASGMTVPSAAVKLAFDTAYNRPPTAREQEIAKKSIAAESDPQEGLRLFIQAMFGANGFLYSY